jgi:indolepyruvate ferredoxin oxidoreductase, alpha subunit
MIELLSGNQAVARGAFEAGVSVAAAYPGTPSTEILENIARYKEIYAEWSVNEKIAFEVAYGAAIGGKRALAAMKHVGVNVAADALMTASYTGVNAGFVLVSADDPGMHSSQNEQDNRYFAKFAKIPMLEPSDSRESRDYIRLALEISEQFDTPVMLRMSTRVCHGKGLVTFNEPLDNPAKKYTKDPQKYVMIPANARKRHVIVEERRHRLLQFAETFSENKIEMGKGPIGIISSGISYQYAREVFPDASFFKLGMTYPLPLLKIKQFAEQFETVYCIEELEPFLQEQLAAAGIMVIGKERLPQMGELSPQILRETLLAQPAARSSQTELPPRPPVMCPGCPHRPVFYVLKKLQTIISGDIGCYTLSTLPPLNTMDTCLCMGSSIGLAQGLVRSMDDKRQKRIVSVLGDSTFIHAGLPSLVNAVYNSADITVVILDNRITAMTGHQDNPGSGITLQGNAVQLFDFEAVARAVGVQFVRTVDPVKIEELKNVLTEAIDFPGPAVVITHRACVLVEREQFPGPMEVNSELCEACKICLTIGCPAMSSDQDAVRIDPDLCFGCALCEQICPETSIARRKESGE